VPVLPELQHDPGPLLSLVYTLPSLDEHLLVLSLLLMRLTGHLHVLHLGFGGTFQYLLQKILKVSLSLKPKKIVYLAWLEFKVKYKKCMLNKCINSNIKIIIVVFCMGVKFGLTFQGKDKD
jgi:hypothetical protein